MKLCRRVLLILTVFSLLFTCLPASADPQVNVAVRGFMAVYDKNRESYLRYSDGTPNDLDSNEYISFALDVTNQSPVDCKYKSAYFRVDGGQNLIWANFSLKAGETATCHIYHVNMSKLDPGLHLVQFFLNDKEVYGFYKC